MSKQSSSKQGGGMSMLGLLGIAFIVLKLCGVIDWSWWWVTAPFWGVLAILAVIWLVCVVIGAFIDALDKAISKRDRKVKE
ncbi:hypothetical protein KP806_07640 [Paenibacillus sp. N4]|uniref:hypothetical protein n=1 Tax=Paenibacillus vietnamensis TaxID=2590547 RepID=UPI001CD0D577|nr:hypothetical protein [Paenibacillus vietnamensis]MCA0754919.1 hypothetical protein [Paenibacillus vietnamensis]